MATTYSYDEEGQLLPESRGEETTSYTYDGNYNRLTKSVTGQPTEEYSYDDADRLLSVASSAGTKSFLYDNCGRTTEEKWNGSTVKSYAWNHDDRLISATGPWGTRSYGYNGLGSRVSETGGQGRSWLRRGAGPTAAVLKDGVNRYSAGGTFRSLAGGTSTFMGGGHKSVDALLSSSQTLTGTVRRDAFGLTKEQTGTWNQPFGFGGNFGYQTDDDTGLELLGNRYYDASIGRFLSRDPIKDGPNWYSYCLNDPINRADPSGHELLTLLVIGAIAGGVALFMWGKKKYDESVEERNRKKRLAAIRYEQVGSDDGISGNSWRGDGNRITECVEKQRQEALDQMQEIYVEGPIVKVGGSVIGGIVEVGGLVGTGEGEGVGDAIEALVDIGKTLKGLFE
ncbi:MAG: RHS repeat-associated core domain-containing protein [Chthonomonadaceae bacterium]|nr:RHS repeat-associated core domain-containing protein [Chthonomonadaceae bacterium]